MEAFLRSKLASALEPVDVDSPRHHRFLALKFASFDAAAECTRRLNDRVFNSVGRSVAVIHKGAKACRPPHIQCRGNGLTQVYGILQELVKACDEPLVPNETRTSTTHTTFVAVNEKRPGAPQSS